MNKEALTATKIRKLLQSNIVMSLKQIQNEFVDRSRSSLFRDMKKLGLVTSYTDTGQFHSLRTSIRFNANGLWFFEQAGFSKWGTLKNTVIEAVSDSPSGMTQRELKNLLRAKVQNTLTHLLQAKMLQRHLLSGSVYVYLSLDQARAEAQLQRRLLINETSSQLMMPAENIIIEILLELIRFPSNNKEPQAFISIGDALIKRGIHIDDDRIAYVLNYYNLKKN
jgi:hypothetical protein